MCTNFVIFSMKVVNGHITSSFSLQGRASSSKYSRTYAIGYSSRDSSAYISFSQTSNLIEELKSMPGKWLDCSLARSW